MHADVPQHTRCGGIGLIALVSDLACCNFGSMTPLITCLVSRDQQTRILELPVGMPHCTHVLFCKISGFLWTENYPQFSSAASRTAGNTLTPGLIYS